MNNDICDVQNLRQNEGRGRAVGPSGDHQEMKNDICDVQNLLFDPKFPCSKTQRMSKTAKSVRGVPNFDKKRQKV